MATLEEFEPSLKEVVQAKRLSATKMDKLKELALKNMEHDTQLVTTLYRTHKSLSPSQKISSLYVFDALARGARHQVNKRGISGDIHSDKGNCATFLLKIEGIVDGLFSDMVSLHLPEAKEKTKKILDIWTKSSTFPTPVLDRLTNIVKDAMAEKDYETNNVKPASVDPRQQTTPPIITQGTTATQSPPTPIAPGSAQSTLLALLSQAANAVASNNGQAISNGVPPPLSMDSAQLALLQQLSQSVQGGAVPTQQPVTLPVSSLVPSSAHVPPVAPPIGGTSQPQPYYRNDHIAPGRPQARDHQQHHHPYDRYNGPERGREHRDNFYDNRANHRGDYNHNVNQNYNGAGGYGRGDFRGRFNRGGFRGRGGGGAGRGRWDDQGPYGDNYRERSREEREWNDYSRGGDYGRSRSRSPPPRGRYQGGDPAGGRWNDEPYHRPPPGREFTDPPPSVPAESSGKDEFGRDIRPESPDGDAPVTAARSPTVSTHTRSPPPSHPQPTESRMDMDISSDPPPPTRSPTVASKESSISRMSSTAASGGSSESSGGLDTFDFSKFNPMEASSWEALGKAWTATNGYVPSQEELMQCVMSGTMLAMQQQGGTNATQEQSWPQADTTTGGQNQSRSGSRWDQGEPSTAGATSARSKGGRGGGGGAGAYSGFVSGGFTHLHESQSDTDAITLSGNDAPESNEADAVQTSTADHSDSTQQQNGVHPGEDRMESSPPQDEGGAPSGKMQRVGDKWVFVRSDAPAPPSTAAVEA